MIGIVFWVCLAFCRCQEPVLDVLVTADNYSQPVSPAPEVKQTNLTDQIASNMIESESEPVLTVIFERTVENGTEIQSEEDNSSNTSLIDTVIIVPGANISSAVNITQKQVTCLPKEANGEPLTIKMVNATLLQALLQPNKSITERSTPAPCVVALFYASWCPYSAQAAQHFNALPRAFPSIDIMAIDSYKEHSVNAIYGVTAVPTVVLFHNGKPAAKYNDSEYSLDLFAAFVTKYTNTTPDGLLNRTSADLMGPVPTVVEKVFDPLLWLCCVFLVVVSVRCLTKTQLWHNWLESLTNTWREAEAQAQHEHND